MKPWLHLARISNLPTVWTNVTAAWLIAGGEPADARLWWLILAGSLLYTGGMILNDAADVKFDREHRQERPIPSGQVSLKAAWIVSVAMLLGGSTLAVLLGASPQITAFLAAAIVFYDLYHKQWAGSVLIMGACRVLLYLMAASAVASDTHMGSILTFHLFGAQRTVDLGFMPAGLHQVIPHALALGCYIVGITLAARMEHRKGTLPALTTLVALVMLYLPAILCARRFATDMADPWQLVVLAAFAILVAYATQTMRQGGPAIGKAVGWLLAGVAIVDALAVSTVSVPLALVFTALAPLLRLWQRRVAAT
ncbi:MAG: UbiA family prenyltransferase [Verrucomicrobiaceae bacterium]|nr:UbiA family prenyltransferase [Verrucomicrobiaceae bacterium]